MTSSQKIGKAAWISFLIASAPLAILIVVVFIGTIFLSSENVGPLEDEPTPLIGLTFFAAELVGDEGPDFVWMIYYICFLILTLSIGIVAAIASICDKPKPESEGCSQ
jgi:hypothetical protein